MDLSRATNERKLYLCRWYFRVGFLLLPFLWGVNAVWFFREAFFKPHYNEQKQIKQYVIGSGIGALIWLAALTSWIIAFQIHRASWGELGDDLSFVIPKGRA